MYLGAIVAAHQKVFMISVQLLHLGVEVRNNKDQEVLVLLHLVDQHNQDTNSMKTLYL